MTVLGPWDPQWSENSKQCITNLSSDGMYPRLISGHLSSHFTNIQPFVGDLVDGNARARNFVRGVANQWVQTFLQLVTLGFWLVSKNWLFNIRQQPYYRTLLGCPGAWLPALCEFWQDKLANCFCHCGSVPQSLLPVSVKGSELSHKRWSICFCKNRHVDCWLFWHKNATHQTPILNHKRHYAGVFLIPLRSQTRH